MSILGMLKKGAQAVTAASSLLGSVPSGPRRKYRVVITLDVEATSKRILEDAARKASPQIDKFAPNIAQLLGLGDEVMVRDARIDIVAAKKEA